MLFTFYMLIYTKLYWYILLKVKFLVTSRWWNQKSFSVLPLHFYTFSVILQQVWNNLLLRGKKGTFSHYHIHLRKKSEEKEERKNIIKEPASLLFTCCFSLPLMSACLSKSRECFWGLGMRPTSSTNQRASHSLPAMVFPSKKSRRDNESKAQRENPTMLTDLGTATTYKIFYKMQYTFTNSK